MTKRDFIFITVIAVLLFACLRTCRNGNSFKAMYDAAQDSLHQTRNKLGQQETHTASLYGSYSDLMKVHAADSSAIGKLQKIVDRHTISATYLNTATGNTITSSTGSVISRDTLWKDSIAYVFPEYRDTINNKWEHFIIAANKDSFHLDYKVFNEFNIVQSWQRPGFLKRKIPIATVTNLNPHTETQEFKSFNLKENKGNRIRDGAIGMAVGALLVTGLQVFDIKIPIHFKK